MPAETCAVTSMHTFMPGIEMDCDNASSKVYRDIYHITCSCNERNLLRLSEEPITITAALDEGVGSRLTGGRDLVVESRKFPFTA